ncbi:HAMP domain-containing sensor histidine kinase [Streptomyces sp. NPDC005236]|uniref:sensor histidine kinase n=1 Tax=Streptomyces sp. NPDC005236 TaxID=3157028 RepID=UPI0033B21662
MSPSRAPRPPRRGRSPHTRPLRTRLLVLIGLALFAVCVTMAITTVLTQRAYLLGDLDRRVGEAAERDRNGVLGDGAGTDLGSFDGRGQPIGTISARLGTDGTVLAAEVVRRSGGRGDLGAAQRAALAGVGTDGRPHTRTVPGLGTYRVAALDGGGRPVLTALPMDDVQDALRGLAVVETVVAGAALTVAGCACAVVVRSGLRPLEQVAAMAAEITRTPLERTEVAGSARTPESGAGPGGELTGRADEVAGSARVFGRGPGSGVEVAGSARPFGRGAGSGGEVAGSARVLDHGAGLGSEADRIGAALDRLVDHVEAARVQRLRGEQRVRAAEERMRRFLSDASHELRTPLASIAGYAELMTRGIGLVEPATAWRRVSAESARMTGLVEDLLLLARLDEGHPPGTAEVDLTVLVAEAVRDSRAAGEDHVWRLGRLPDSPALVAGDEAGLRQVVANLLANARTHTPAGTTVVTTVEVTGTSCAIRVRDDGPGIPPTLLPSVFEPFTRADASRSRVSPGHGGSGLGLAVAEAVTKAHRGRIHAESASGRTEFTVQLPALRPVPAPRLPTEADPHERAPVPRTGGEAAAFPRR